MAANDDAGEEVLREEESALEAAGMGGRGALGRSDDDVAARGDAVRRCKLTSA